MCIKVNPDIWEPNCKNGSDHYCPNCDNTLDRKIYLSDVLLAKKAKINDLLSSGMTPKNFSNMSQMAESLRNGAWSNITNHWDMKKEFIDQQDPEVVDFIHSLLT